MKRLLMISSCMIIAQTNVAGDFCCIKTPDAKLIRQAVFKQAKPGHTVLFDIDGVLLTAKEHHSRGMLRDADIRGSVDELLMDDGPYAEQLSKHEREELYSQFLVQHEECAISNEMTDLVHDLQKESVEFASKNPTQYITVMAITQAKVRKYGAIDSLIKWRSEQLAKVARGGISFKTAFPDYNGHEFASLSNDGDTPAMVDGILAACQACTKSKLFFEFMKMVLHIEEPITVETRAKIQEKIPAVHLVEDSEANLKEMKKFCENVLGIPFYGYLFTGESMLTVPFDKQIAAEQMRRLVEEKKWPSYAEVKAALSQKKEELIAEQLQKIEEELGAILVFEQIP